MKVLDLFSGIGGFSLGLERTGGFETVAFCEINPFCCNVLRKHWPEVPNIGDITAETFCVRVPYVDVVCGGFPCQAHSCAARGRNIKEKDLWPAMAGVLKFLKPKIWISENVQEKPIRTAQEFAKSIGYRTTVKSISAFAGGAWHRRNRWFLVAHPYDESEFCSTLNAEVAKLPGVCSGLWTSETYARAIRVHDGVSSGLDEHRRVSLGNAVMPQKVECIGRAIMEIENERKTQP